MKALAIVAVLAAVSLASAADLKLGIIGTDTSHAVVFTKFLNDVSATEHVAGATVVAAYKGGSPDLEFSRTHVDEYAHELRTKWNIEFVSDISSLCGKVDGLLLESVDGRVHLSQAKDAIRCGKPIFIDKPLAATLQDAHEIARLAEEAGVPWFSTSTLRYGGLASSLKVPDIRAAITWGPGPSESHLSLDVSWYAIHPIEMLYSVLGPGCQEVTRTSTADGDVITGRWRDGRTGTVRTGKVNNRYGGVVFTSKDVVVSAPQAAVDYKVLVEQLVAFFQTGRPPVSNNETLEIFEFMDAALRSLKAGGNPVALTRPLEVRP